MKKMKTKKMKMKMKMKKMIKNLLEIITYPEQFGFAQKLIYHASFVLRNISCTYHVYLEGDKDSINGFLACIWSNCDIGIFYYEN